MELGDGELLGQMHPTSRPHPQPLNHCVGPIYCVGPGKVEPYEVILSVVPQSEAGDVPHQPHNARVKSDDRPTRTKVGNQVRNDNDNEPIHKNTCEDEL